jgi:hypothetical protein
MIRIEGNSELGPVSNPAGFVPVVLGLLVAGLLFRRWFRG